MEVEFCDGGGVTFICNTVKYTEDLSNKQNIHG